MSSYYYLEDPNSEFGYSPIPGEEYVMAISRIARKHGVKITDVMILKELEEMRKEKKEKYKSLSVEEEMKYSLKRSKSSPLSNPAKRGV